jgi:uncharacterized membrane protein (UPF0127 family)
MPQSLRIAAITLLLIVGISVPGVLLAKHQSESKLTTSPESNDIIFVKDSLEISTKGGKQHRFTVEIADTFPSRAQGLMFRKHLDKDAGMLFLFDGEDIFSMWMKNTYIPLDMVFIRKDGTIARIEKNTTPESLQSISSGSPVVAVLELNAGICEALGITSGDMVIYKAFNKEKQ